MISALSVLFVSRHLTDITLAVLKFCAKIKRKEKHNKPDKFIQVNDKNKILHILL